MFDAKRVGDFLLQNGMHPACVDLDVELGKFKAEMVAGLEKAGGSSLLMLPTYIDAAGEVPVEESAIVIDAGGTNLRVALVRFDDKRAPVTEYYEKYAMPGSTAPVTKEEMFDQIAAYVAPIIKESTRIGFCFSYVFESTPRRDGVMHAMCKEVTVTGIDGALACEELEAAFQRRGAEGTRRYVMLNDTVATQLGAKAVHGDAGCSGYVGFILGTGLNTCYTEQVEQIKKLPPCDYSSKTMIVNMESGVYTGFAQGAVEKKIDARSQYPGDHMYEKMLSGGYFGDIVCETLKLACAEGLFHAAFCDAIGGLDTVNLREITEYILQKEVLQDNFYEHFAAQNEDDRQTLNLILELLYERVAKLLTVMFCAIAEDTDTGADAACPLRICAEGTTYYRSPLLLKYLNGLLENYAKGERGRYIEMVQTKNATLVGTALAALIN